MTSLVSIIIPFYNVENYIKRILSCFTNQTYKNIEIICIDDGSEDKSRELIKSFSAEDNRIKYFYQKNAGVSAARNRGLDVAEGKYIIFADSDDLMHHRAVELLVDYIEKLDAPAVFSDYAVNPNQDVIDESVENFDIEKIQKNHFFETINRHAIWGAIYKADVLKTLRFNEKLNNAEDYEFLMKLVYQNDDLGYKINCRLYYYYLRRNSLSDLNFKSKINELKSNELILDSFSDNDNSYLRRSITITFFKSLIYVKSLVYMADKTDENKKYIKQLWKKRKSLLSHSKDISVKEKLKFAVFYYFNRLYDFFRILFDPTIKDFYKEIKNDTQ